MTSAATSRVVQLLVDIYGGPDHGNKPNPMDELIFILLSQMTTGPSYNRVYERLRQSLGSWDRLLDVDEPKLVALIADAGLAATRAARLRQIARQLYEEHGAVTLDALRDLNDAEALAYLTALPGVGVKTAKCVLALSSLARPVLPVDTHVDRVCWRLGLSDRAATPARRALQAEAAVPPPLRARFHLAALAHGQQVCRALRPRCSSCPLAELCPSSQAASTAVDP